MCNAQETDDSQRYDRLFLEAIIEREKGNDAAAFEMLRRCLDIRPDASEAYYYLAHYYLRMKDSDKALSAFKKASQLEPDNVNYLETLAQMLQKCTEGEYGCTTIHSLYIDNNATLSPVTPKKRLIEAYGDSYTCGYGTEGLTASEKFKLETENCNKAYIPIMARYFDADYRIIAHSGNGMVRNWGDKKQKSEVNMSTRYTQLYDDFAKTPFNYSQRRPDRH